MKIAALSDVHGNTPALRAVLKDIANRSVDIVVNLGDVASGGIDPRGTLDLVRSSPAMITARGNHERQLLELTPREMTASDRLAHGLLTADDKAWLAALTNAVPPHPNVLACHGTPSDDRQYLLHTVREGGLDYDFEESASVADSQGRRDIAFALRTGRIEPSRT